MDFKIIGSVFTSKVSISTTSAADIVVKDCLFSGYETPTIALSIESEGHCRLFRCCIENITSGPPTGYSILCRSVDSEEVSLSLLSLFDQVTQGGGVQNIKSERTSLKSNNVTNVIVEHICFASLYNSSVAIACFLNGYNLSATVRGSGIQFTFITDFASLQCANFVKIFSPKYAIVRAYGCSTKLYAAHCFFAEMTQEQNAFHGDSPICVLSSSASLNSLFSLNVVFFDNFEIPKSLNIMVRTRNAYRPSEGMNCAVLKITQLIFFLPLCWIIFLSSI